MLAPLTYSTAVPVTLVACCPASMRQVIYDKMQQAIQAVQAGTASIDISGISPTGAQQLVPVGRLKQQLQNDFKCGILLAVNTAAQTCSITCLKVMLPAVEAQVRAALGLPAQQPQAASAAAATPLQHEQRAVKALLVSCPSCPSNRQSCVSDYSLAMYHVYSLLCTSNSACMEYTWGQAS